MPSSKSIVVYPLLNTKSVTEVSLSLRSGTLHSVDPYKLDQRAFTELLQGKDTHRRLTTRAVPQGFEI